MEMAHVIHNQGHVFVQLVGEVLDVTAHAPWAPGDLTVPMNVDVEMVLNANTKRGSACVCRAGEVQTVHIRALQEPSVITAFRHVTAVIMPRVVAMMVFANVNQDGWALDAHKHARRVTLGVNV